MTVIPFLDANQLNSFDISGIHCFGVGFFREITTQKRFKRNIIDLEIEENWDAEESGEEILTHENTYNSTEEAFFSFFPSTTNNDPSLINQNEDFTRTYYTKEKWENLEGLSKTKNSKLSDMFINNSESSRLTSS